MPAVDETRENEGGRRSFFGQVDARAPAHTPFFAPQSKTHPTMQGPLASTVTPYERGRRFLKPGESMRSGEAMTSVDCKSKLVRMRER